jgi:hypothetical protein
MPSSFRIGLIATVLVLSAVRMLKSFRNLRHGPPSQEAGSFSWRRWYYLATLWGVVFFCAPFVLAVALPSEARRVSAAIDAFFVESRIRPDVSPAGPDPGRPVTLSDEEAAALMGSQHAGAQEAEKALRDAQRLADRERSEGWAWLAGAGAAAALLIAIASLLCRRRMPATMSAAAFAGLLLSGGAFAFAGIVSTRISGAPSARRSIEEYARARPIGADQATKLVGPIRLIGRPSDVVDGTQGYLYFSAPGQDPEDVRAPWSGFKVGPVRVAPAERADLLIILPSARLGRAGRELMISAEEDVMVMGYLKDGELSARPGLPIVVAPAGARRVFDRLSQELFGAAKRRSLCTAMLQVAFGAAAAWFLTLLVATVSELTARRIGRQPIDLSRLEDTDKHPSITQMLRYGG